MLFLYVFIIFEKRPIYLMMDLETPYMYIEKYMTKLH